jgi:ADP-ribose pyrophosphatase YjhB (NUDIX family)
VVFDADGRVLLVRRRDPPGAGRYSLPGGRPRRSEPLEGAIVREVLEETSLVVRVLSDLGTVDVAAEGFAYAIREFLCALPDAPRAHAPPARAGDDATDARWATPEELPTLGLSPEVRALIDRARRVLSSTSP